MTEYLVTLKLERESGGYYRIPEAVLDCDGDGGHWLALGPHIVSVEPVPRLLPTEFGALILARLSDETQPSLLTLGQCDGQDVWFSASHMHEGPVMLSEIGPDWVEIDPATLRPKDAT